MSCHRSDPMQATDYICVHLCCNWHEHAPPKPYYILKICWMHMLIKHRAFSEECVEYFSINYQLI